MLIAPLERLVIPDHALDGSNGLNRAPHNPSNPTVVNTDIDAVALFLDSYKARPTTQRSYTKECERLILWAVNVKGVPLSSLSYSDMRDFMDFLKDPQPVDEWSSCKTVGRADAGWRPFIRHQVNLDEPDAEPVYSAGLAPSSRLTAFAACSAMFEWLVGYGYLIKNPMRQLKSMRKEIRADDPRLAPDRKVERYMDEEMWAAFKDAIEQIPKDTKDDEAKYERALFLSSAIFYLAPRAHELVNAKMNDFVKHSGMWWWRVFGKGMKWSEIPAVDGMIEALIRYREHLGLSPLPMEDDGTFLVRPLKGGKDGKRIGPRALNSILYELFEQAAKLLEATANAQKSTIEKAEYETRAAKMRKASSHWGRHTSITFQVRSGIDKGIVQLNARHEDPRTTNLYVHEDLEHWHKEANKLHQD